MRLRAESTDPASVQADVLAIPIYKEDKEISGDLAALDAATGGAISQAIDWGEFNILEHYTALVDAGPIAADKLLLVNGVRRGRGAWRARRIASTATRRLQGRGVQRMALWLRDGEEADGFISAGVGALQGTYRPYAYDGRVRDTQEMLRSVEEVVLIGDGVPAAEVIEQALIVAEGVEFGRTLANRASNDLYPERMAEVARELEADGCTVEVLDVGDMQRLG
ncbi:MAG TPA: hypothetical protein VF114_06015, partial [Candidatus Limnocylindria bacterium]